MSASLAVPNEPDIVAGHSRLVYDRDASAILSGIYRALHQAEAQAHGTLKDLIAQAHCDLHDLAERLVGNEIRAQRGAELVRG